MTARIDRLPVAGLSALAVAGFVTILTEALPAGLLPQIGASLGVSEAMAGQWISIYALGSLLAAIPLTATTRSWRRRPLLLGAVTGFAIANLITALLFNTQESITNTGFIFDIGRVKRIISKFLAQMADIDTQIMRFTFLGGPPDFA